MSYFITTPAKGKGVNTLHKTRCREVHSRARRMSLETLAVATPHVVNDLPCCDLCLDGNLPTEARADAWRAHLRAAHNQLEEKRRNEAHWKRQQDAKDAFLAQFERVRRHCEVMWGQPVRFGSYTGQGNVSLTLGHPTWHDIGHIELKATDGDNRLEVVGMNFSTSVIGSAQDAHRLSGVFHVISDWRSYEPLDVPAGAPHFYTLP